MFIQQNCQQQVAPLMKLESQVNRLIKKAQKSTSSNIKHIDGQFVVLNLKMDYLINWTIRCMAQPDDTNE